MSAPHGVVSLIGAGHFGAALVRGFIRAGFGIDSLLISARGRESAALAATYGLERVADNAALVRRAKAVVLAVRPSEAAEAVRDLPWRPNQLLLSVCAGVRVATLSEATAGRARVVRALPMTSAEFGASPTPLFPDDGEAHALLAHLGTVVALAAEEEMAAATAAAIAYTFAHDLIARTGAWAADQGLTAKTGRALAAAYVEAAARAMAADKATPPDELIARLATKGGIAEAAYGPLRAARHGETWRAALDAALARVRALAGTSSRRTETN